MFLKVINQLLIFKQYILNNQSFSPPIWKVIQFLSVPYVFLSHVLTLDLTRNATVVQAANEHSDSPSSAQSTGIKGMSHWGWRDGSDRGKEQQLLFHRTLVRLLAPTWQLTTVARGSDAFFWILRH